MQIEQTKETTIPIHIKPETKSVLEILKSILKLRSYDDVIKYLIIENPEVYNTIIKVNEELAQKIANIRRRKG